METVRVPLVIRINRSTGEMTADWGDVNRETAAAYGQRLAAALNSTEPAGASSATNERGASVPCHDSQTCPA